MLRDCHHEGKVAGLDGRRQPLCVYRLLLAQGKLFLYDTGTFCPNRPMNTKTNTSGAFQHLLAALKTQLKWFGDGLPEPLAMDLANHLSAVSQETELLAHVHALKAEAVTQRKRWMAATQDTQRPSRYRLPQLPEGYQSLVPTERPEVDNCEQTEVNYGATLLALEVACRLYLATQPARSGVSHAILDGKGDVFHVYPAHGTSLKLLRAAYRRAVRTAHRIDADNYLQGVVFAELAMQGHHSQGPLELHDWSSDQ